ncbi:MAG: PilZ domain-containing protein [Comamonadaceae bacterium]|nr:MAG: PilZ domain-containing protein [Comamonadaceae bacterium]
MGANQTARMFREQRVDPREPLALPLRLEDGSSAVTRDISASGMYFETQGSYDMPGPLIFEMQIVELGVKFTAEGEVVRVERHPKHTGFAIRLHHPRFEPLSITPPDGSPAPSLASGRLP